MGGYGRCGDRKPVVDGVSGEGKRLRRLAARVPPSVVAAATFVVLWIATTPDSSHQPGARDLTIYRRWGEAIAHGAAPYRDVPIDYPPGAVPFFVAPALGSTERSYLWIFSLTMLLCGLALIAIVPRLGAAVGLTRPQNLAALAVIALLPAVLAPVLQARYDLWPTLLLASSVLAAALLRHRLAALLLGFAVVAKGFPVVAAPLLLTWAWRTRGRREAAIAGALLLGSIAAVATAFAVVGGPAVVHPFKDQWARPLQVESSGAAFLIALHHLRGWTATVRGSYGSDNLINSRADVIATLSVLLELATLAYVWLRFARKRSPETGQLIAACGAATAAFVALGKVLSPQFVVWLAPFAIAATARRRAILGCYAAVLVLTHLIYPGRYQPLIDSLALTPSLLVIARDLLLIALTILFVLSIDRLYSPRR